MQLQLAWLERRSRRLTGIVLAALALGASYSLLIFEGQLARQSLHFYPWVMAVLFYAAGDLLAYVWFKVVTLKLTALLMSKPPRIPGEEEAGLEPGLAAQDVEVVRPGEGAE